MCTEVGAWLGMKIMKDPAWQAEEFGFHALLDNEQGCDETRRAF